MSLAIPITNGQMSAQSTGFTTLTHSDSPPPMTAAPSGGMSTAELQGTGSLTGTHNTPLHVGVIVLGAAAVLAAFHLGGFRFAFDVGMGRG